MPIVKVTDCGKGVNRDLPPFELAPGQWSDCMNARFRNGLAEKRKGVAAAFTTPAVTPYWGCTYLTTASRFVVEAGTARVDVDDGTTQSQITRYTEGVEIASSTNSTVTATVNTSSAHGRTSGDTITRFGAFPEAYNGTFVITVSDADTFTYTMLSDPGGSATIQGQYSYNVQSDFTGARDDRWTGGVFNGVLVMNNGVDAPQYWNGDVTTRLRKFPGWLAGQKCDALVIFKNYLIALAPTIDGVKQPHTILWAAAAEPGAMPTEWTATTTNDAGATPQAAETGGFMVDGSPFGDTLYAFKQDARFGVQYIGGNDVFRVFRVPGNDGLLTRGCIANTPKGQVFLSNGDVKIHNGGEAESIADGLVRRWLFNTMDTTYAARSFVVTNPQKNEVWICFPTVGNTDCDRALVWNWVDRTWGDFSIAGMTFGTIGLVASTLNTGTIDGDSDPIDTDATTNDENEYSPNESRLILFHSTPKIGLADTGSTDFGSTVPFMLEKTGISFDDSETVKVISATRPQISSAPGAVLSIYHGGAMTADADPTYGGAITFIVGTSNWADGFGPSGRYLAHKIISTDFPIVSLRSDDFNFGVVGR